MKVSSGLRSRYFILAALFLLVASMMYGCSGDDGATGAQGPGGPAGPAGPAGKDASAIVDINALSADEMAGLTMTGTVTSVTIASPPVVNFKVTDAAGNGVKGLGAMNTAGNALNYLRFAIAKLVPGTNGSLDAWVSYMVTSATSRPSTENNGTLKDNGDGTYTYTFVQDVKDPTKTGGVTFDGSLTHRLAIQVSGSIPGSTPAVSIANPLNIIYDFIPNGGTVTARHDVTSMQACNSCHGKIGTTTPHGGRIDTRYCVVCHTDQRKNGRTEATTTATGYSGSTYMINGQAEGNFVILVHRTHMGNKLTKTGYNYGGVLANEVGYPQDQTNCRKCHSGTAIAAGIVSLPTPATTQGDNWKTKPTRIACGACHDRVNFATGANHIGGAKADDSQCALCHDATDIEANHITINPTPNNPNVPAGATNFTYDINSVTVSSSGQPIVKFRIMASTNGSTPAPVTFNGSGSNPLAGFTGSPSFLVAYADGTDTSVDYNNKGRSAAQPASVSIANLLDGTKGSLGTQDSTGYYTATITDAAAKFPAGSKLRAVALQGYFTQVNPALSRHTIAVVKGVTNDTARRSVVDPAKCANCHEWFEGHGGNRVYETQVCIVCHNPNLSSSGTTVDLAAPEATQNLKDMIHSIHAGAMRTTPYKHTRAKSGANTVYDWSDVVFPGILSKCDTCHKPGTFDADLPAGVLMTTDVTTSGPGATTATITAARNTVPNATDLVTTPVTSTCVACHDATTSKAHMSANGGTIRLARSSSSSGSEQCAICHGVGKTADVTVIHK